MNLKRKKVTVIFHSLYDGKDYTFKKRGKRKWNTLERKTDEFWD